MKKILSILLCAAMLAGAVTLSVGAKKATDQAMLLDDISIPDDSKTGALGYIVNASAKNDYGVKAFGSDKPYAVDDQNGISVAFDLNVLSYSKCNHLVSEIEKSWRHQSALTFTFSNYNGYQAIIYDISRQEIQIANIGWPRSGINPDMAHVVESKKIALNPGDWHRMFYSIQYTEVYVYIDGVQVLYHDFDGGEKNNLDRSFLMFWPSHCRCMIDNLIVGTDEYDDSVSFEENEGQVLFADDFNDAIAPELDHVEQVETWELVKDANGNTLYVDVLDEKGNPVYGDDGKIKQTTVYARDEKGNLIQEKDDKGKPVFHDEYYYKVNGEVVNEEGATQYHAGFLFEPHNGQIPYKGVDKDTYCGMIKDVENATISFADTQGVEGQTFRADVTTTGGFTKATGLVFAVDPIFSSATFEDVATGVAINVDNGLADITLPAGFSGKIATLVLNVPADRTMAQSDKYRYGFIINSGTTFETSDGAVPHITIDGGFTVTKNFVKGDANGDGKINTRDVILLMKYIIIQNLIKKGYVPTAEDQKLLDSMIVKAADCYPDGKINTRDTQNLMKYMVSGEWPA